MTRILIAFISLNPVFLKIALCAVIVAACTTIGARLSMNYRNRERALREIIMFCDFLVSNISFARSNLKDNVNAYMLQCRSDFKSVLLEYLAVLESGKYPDGEELKNNVKKYCLNAEEYGLLIQFLDTLGKSDADTQVFTIKGFKTAFAPYCENAKILKKKYGTLYIKLGVLAGAGISIILI